MNRWPDLPLPATPTARARPSSRVRVLFRHAFAPALLGAMLGALAMDREAPGSVAGFDFTTAAFLLSLGAVWIAEWLFPANRAWNYNLLAEDGRGWSVLGHDLAYFFFVTQLTVLLLRPTRWAVEHAVQRLGAHLPHLWPSGAPFAVRAGLAFLLVELGSYWFHRAAHHVELLWRFHSTHHVIESLTGIKSVRTHPVDNALFFIARMTPLLLLGAGAEELAAATYLGSILGVLSHANVDLAPGVLRWFVNFPSDHAVHHSAEIDESRSNYGCHTVIWDRVFGTYRSGDVAPAELGVRPLGTRTLWQELVAPLYRRIG